jgi:hypothetical protein
LKQAIPGIISKINLSLKPTVPASARRDGAQQAHVEAAGVCEGNQDSSAGKTIMTLNGLKLHGSLINDGRFYGGLYRSGVEKRNMIKCRPVAPACGAFAEIIIHIERLAGGAP